MSWRESALRFFAELTARLREAGDPEHWVRSSSPGICMWFTALSLQRSRFQLRYNRGLEPRKCLRIGRMTYIFAETLDIEP